jgi:hypothetical protein
MGKTATGTVSGVFGSLGSAGQGAIPGSFSRTDGSSVTAGSGNSFDCLNATTAGVRLVVNITAISGTSPTIAFSLSDSADNTTFAAVSGMTIAAQNAIGTYSVSTAGPLPVRRYVALGTTVTGTTPSVTFNASVDREAVAFTAAVRPDGSAQKDTRT